MSSSPSPGRKASFLDDHKCSSGNVLDDEEVILSYIKGKEGLPQKGLQYWFTVVKVFFVELADNIDIGGVHIDDWNEADVAFPLVMFNFGLYLIAFIYFSVTLTQQGTEGKFLSLEGSSEVQTCVEVPITITQAYQGDVFGYWETDLEFRTNSSAFVLQMVGTQATMEEYSAALQSFKDQLKALSVKSQNRDSGWNAMMWASFLFRDEGTKMTFYSSADTSIIFEGDVQMGWLTSAPGGPCMNDHQYGYYDRQSSKLIYRLPTTAVTSEEIGGWVDTSNLTAHGVPLLYLDTVHLDWQNRETCGAQYPTFNWTSWDPALYNGGDDTSQGFTEVGFDVRTLTTVMSLNMKVVELSSMTPTTSAFGSAGSGGIPGLFYYDDIYAPMDPFFCVDKQAVHDQGMMKLTPAQIHGPPLCFLVKPTKYTPLFFYPMSMSMFYGGNLATSIYHHCECPDNQMEPGCNARNYMVGLFYDMDRGDLTKSLQFALQVQKFLIDDPQDGDLHMQQFFTEFLASCWQISPPAGRSRSSYPYLPIASVPSNSSPSIHPFVQPLVAPLSFLTSPPVHPITCLPTGPVLANETFDVSSWGYTPMPSEAFHMMMWKKICPWMTCGAITFNVFRDPHSSSFLGINEFNYQPRLAPKNNLTYAVNGFDLPNEMCRNLLYDEDMMSGFLNHPPRDLVEPYFECQQTQAAALYAAVGNAAGMAGMMNAVALLAWGFVFRSWYNSIQVREGGWCFICLVCHSFSSYGSSC